MRRWQGTLLFACLAGLLCPGERGAVAQGGKAPTYWANHKIDIPVNVDAIKKYHTDQKLPEPRDLQLFAARNGGEFLPQRKVAFTNLDKTGEGKNAIWFTADKDGSYEFAVQFLYADGTSNPPTEKLRPQQLAIIDTVPPAIQIRGSGNVVDWTVTDDNLEPGSIKLECKRPTWSEWTPIKDRAMRATDRYAWKLGPTDELEVRVVARDKAGNEGVSSLVRLPAAGGGANPRPVPNGGGAGEWPPPAPGANAPRPRVLYVNTMSFDVDYTIERMGRSGVKAAHLLVRKENGQGDWMPAGSKELPANVKDQKLSLPYTADREGLYGFYVIPESGAGVKAPMPRRDDPAQVLVVVDTAKPKVQITDINVRPGGARGPIVDIMWEAADQNLVPNGINLEYSADNKVTWKEIKYRLSNQPGTNAGRFEWDVPDTELWKFHVRIRASDQALNTGEHVYDKLVMVDLEPPGASINTVRTNGTPPASAPPPVSDPPKKTEKKDPQPEPAAGGSTGPTLPPLPLGGGVAPPVPPGGGSRD